MFEQENFILNIFEKNLAKEMTFENILHHIMRLKNTTEPADVDVLGILKSLESLTKKEKIFKQNHAAKNFWGDRVEDKIVFFRVKGMA